MSVVDDWNPHACPEPPCTVCTKGSAHLAFTLQRNSRLLQGGLILPCATSEAHHTPTHLSGALRSAYSGFSWLWRLFSSWFQLRDTLHQVSQQVVFSPCSSFQYSNATPWTPRNLMDGPSRGYQVPMGLPIGVVPRKRRRTQKAPAHALPLQLPHVLLSLGPPLQVTQCVDLVRRPSRAST